MSTIKPRSNSEKYLLVSDTRTRGEFKWLIINLDQRCVVDSGSFEDMEKKLIELINQTEMGF